MISIIVPVYNSERFLAMCIESILKQSYTNWELLLIDDGSTDSSRIICNNYAQKDKRIRYVYKSNEGVTNARKKGWEQSNGEWITFVDSDDTLPNNSLELLYRESEKADADIIEGYHYFREDLPRINCVEDYRRNLLKGVDVVSVAIWGKLFKKEILNSWCFDIPPEIVRGEDWIMNIRIAFLSNKTPILIPDKVYNYQENNMSLSHIHKKNIDLEYTFFQTWSDSIPPSEKDKFSKNVVRIAVLMYVGVCVTDLGNVEVVESPFAKQINQLVKKETFSLKFHQKILLQSKNRWLRHHIWRAHCFKKRFFG